MPMKNAYGFGLLTVLFWSTSATAFKITLQYLDVLQLLLVAIITSTFILGVFLGFQGKLGIIFRLKKREYLFYLGLGVLNPFIYYWMAVKAYDLLPAQIVQPINYTWAITLGLLSIPLLKQPFGKLQILATLICYSGVVAVSWRSGANASQINLMGVFLAVSCTFIWALYWIYNIRSQQDPVIVIFLNFLFSIPFVLVACLMFSSISIHEPKGLMGGVWIGCFEFGFAFIAWIFALKGSPHTSHVTNLIFLTPFLSLAFIHYILGEEILIQTYIGLVLILSGIGLQNYGKVR